MVMMHYLQPQHARMEDVIMNVLTCLHSKAYDGDGGCYAVIFAAPHAERRARDVRA